jgi:hypothetical protein
MDYNVIGFFIGAAPGMAYWLWRGIKLRRLGKIVERVAAAEGKSFSTDYSYQDQWRFIWNPRSLIEDGDSPSLIAAKENLIKGRKHLFLFMFMCSLLALFGGIVGVLLFSLIGS